MNVVKVFLAGEGQNELGSRFGHRAYQTDERPGVIVALLSRVSRTGWEVGGARGWSSSKTKSFVATPNSSTARGIARARVDREDTRIVLIVANDAIEAECSVLAFLRDADKDEQREQAVLDGIEMIPSTLNTELKTIGAVVVPKLEAWVLAALGNAKTEDLTPAGADRELAGAGIDAKSTEAFVAVFDDESLDLDELPADATRLRGWLARAREVLPPHSDDG